MAESRRTYRVPKRIAEGAASALVAARSSGVGLGDISAVTVAQALSANLPVSLDVPQTINAFFTPGWRYSPSKADQVALYGGEAARQWAQRCTSAATTVLTAAGEVVEDDDDDDLDDDIEEPLDDETYDRLMDYYESFLPEVVPDVEDPEPLDLPADAVEEQVETALGLATALDETVGKLAEALEDALVSVDDDDALVELDGYFAADELRTIAIEGVTTDADGALVPPSDSWFSDEERAEASMVRDALAEVIRGRSSLSASTEPTPDLNKAAKAAKERMGAANLQRKRSLAMARMAAKRLNLPTTFEGEPTSPEDEGEPPPPEEEVGGEPPKEPPDESPADHQPRAGHGRFTGVGTRVRDREGREGFIAGTVGRRAIIQGDDGKVRLMEPHEYEVARKGRAVLRQKPEPVGSPSEMMADYLAEMQRRMGLR